MAQQLMVTSASRPEQAPGWWQALSAWVENHGELLGWLFVGSLVSLVLCLLLLPVVVVRLPADYFAKHRAHAPPPSGALGWAGRVVRNLVGAVFVLIGVALLLLPGQGLLTILIGVLLLDFPGKRRLERALIARKGIRRLLDGMRTKRGRAPFELD